MIRQLDEKLLHGIAGGLTAVPSGPTPTGTPTPVGMKKTIGGGIGDDIKNIVMGDIHDGDFKQIFEDVRDFLDGGKVGVPLQQQRQTFANADG